METAQLAERFIVKGFDSHLMRCAACRQPDVGNASEGIMPIEWLAP